MASMTCFHPIPYYMTKYGEKDFQVNNHNPDRIGDKKHLNCRQCSGCRYARLRQWATRIYCESKLHSEACFLTLTYAPEHLPENQNLAMRDMTLFWKRLRKQYPHHKMRYFYSGEYGDRFKRPHYHAILMGFDPLDKKPTGKRGSYNTFRSQSIDQIWGKGHVDIGEANMNSIMYTAGYVQKKAIGRSYKIDPTTGKSLGQLYEWPDFITGEIIEHNREFALMSRRPGIGADYVLKYHQDIYKDDCIVFPGGFKAKVPNYFDKIYASMGTQQEAHLEQIKAKRLEDFLKYEKEAPDNHLLIKKSLLEQKLKGKSKRSYE